MNNNDEYSVCTILYKTDNSDGWYYAIMSGDEKECQRKCEQLKLENNWYDYKCYVSSWCAIKRNIPFQNSMPQADYIHQCTDLIYNPFDKKFYYPKETMPYPETRKRTINKFEMIVKGEGEDDEYIWMPDDVEEFESGTDITISFGHPRKKITTIAENIKKDVNKFIKQLKTNGYANFSVEEYTYTKFLAWVQQDKIRLIVQYYGDSNIETEFDKLMSKEMFYKEFKKLNSQLQKYIVRHNKLYNDFKMFEEFIQSLKWEFDISSYDKPLEYSCLEWDNDKMQSFQMFQKIIRAKSEEQTVDFNTREKLYCYKSEDYYYWCNENKIIRKLFYNYKIKDIIRFIKSGDFKYKKGMSLTDVYNQLLDKGYYQVIECKYRNKKVYIYANGQVESKEVAQNEQKELEQLIRQLAETIEDKENLTVSQFVELLEPNISYISFRDNKMRL